jgi:hypothetical protein
MKECVYPEDVPSMSNILLLRYERNQSLLDTMLVLFSIYSLIFPCNNRKVVFFLTELSLFPVIPG